MTENQFWWVTIGESEPEVVRVRFDYGKPAHVFSTGAEFDFDSRYFEDLQLSLIERVLPAGRAAAAVQELERALVEPGSDNPFGPIHNTIAILREGTLTSSEPQDGPGKGDFVPPHWSELFDGPEAYLTWRAAQGAA